MVEVRGQFKSRQDIYSSWQLPLAGGSCEPRPNGWPETCSCGTVSEGVLMPETPVLVAPLQPQLRGMDRQTSPTSGLEVADGEQGDGLGLAMLYPDPSAGVLCAAGALS